MAEDVKSGGDVSEPKDTAEQPSLGEMLERYRQGESELRGAAGEFKRVLSEKERAESELKAAGEAESAALTALREAKQRVTGELKDIAFAVYEDPSLSDLDKAIGLMAAHSCWDAVDRSDAPGAGRPDYVDRVAGYRETAGFFNEILPAYQGEAVVKVLDRHVIVGRVEGAEVRGVTELSGCPETPKGSFGIDVSGAAVSRFSYRGVTTIADGRVFNPEIDIHESNVVRLNKVLLTDKQEPAAEEAVERELIYLGDDVVTQLVETLNQGEDEASAQLLHELWIAASKAGVDLEGLVPDMAGEISEWRVQTKKTLVSQAASIAYGFAVNDPYSNEFLKPGMEVWKPADLMRNAELIGALGLDREEIITDTLSLLKQSKDSRVSNLAHPTVLALLSPREEE